VTAGQGSEGSSSERDGGVGRGVRVLIADDDPKILATLAILLRDHSFEVELVRGGIDVMMAVANFRPHGVLLDLAMPDRSGFDLAEELSRRYGERCPMLIAVTAHDTADDRQMAEISGFHHFVPKPFNAAAMLRLLASLAKR